MGLLDRHRHRADPEVRGQRVRVGEASLAREAGGHEHADHVLGPEGVGRDRGDERRVDAARQPDEHVGEAVLADVVARAEHERLVDLAHRFEQRLDPVCAPGPAELRLGDRDLRQLRSPQASTRIERPAAERGVHVDVADEQVLLELLGPGHEVTALVEQHRRAVEDELVLAADEVDIEDGHRRVGRARREHRLALAQAARVEGRGVDVHDELGATRSLRQDRTVRAPRVLADRDGHAHAGDHEQRAVARPRLEVALLVEHGVVREQVLPVDAEHAAVRADRGRVVEVTVGLGEPDHRRHPAGAGGELLERLPGLRDERGPQQQVLRGIPGDRELGEGHEVAVESVRPLVGVEQARRVALEVTDDEIELRGRDAQACHDERIRPAPGREPRTRPPP